MDPELKHWIVVGLPWLMSAVSIYFNIKVGDKSSFAWRVGLTNQCAYCFWIIVSENWGWLPECIMVGIIYYRNHQLWKKLRKESLA